MTSPNVPITPDVPIKMEISVELVATPEAVWDAIATANGISSWFLPTELEEHEGGRVVFHMGETSSEGTVTGWEPPHRIVYEEPGWAELGGRAGADVTPLVTEFLVEAQAGGTCTVRVVSSAFGTGADWEREFFDAMEQGWRPFFDNLRLYLALFPGQHVTSLSVDSQLDGEVDAVWAALRAQLGARDVGAPVDTCGVAGFVERISTTDGVNELLVRVERPIPGFLQFMAHPTDDGKAITQIEGYLFSPDAAAYVEQERRSWKAWLERLAVLAA